MADVREQEAACDDKLTFFNYAHGLLLKARRKLRLFTLFAILKADSNSQMQVLLFIETVFVAMLFKNEISALSE